MPIVDNKNWRYPCDRIEFKGTYIRTIALRGIAYEWDIVWPRTTALVNMRPEVLSLVNRRATLK